MDVQQTLDSLKNEMNQLRDERKNKLSMVVFSGDLDKLLAAFIIATGAAAMGMEVVQFFTFWATPALRDKKKKGKGKDLFGKMFGFMLPRGAGKVKLSKMNMGGMGTGMMQYLMKRKKVASLPDMIGLAAEMGVRQYICEMSMDLMGFKQEEMIDYPGREFVGVAKFLEEAGDSKIQLFI
ncbi:MAG TPA: DsrE/DsrF/DrsH-like family protein [Spirochaetota bacterium]|nr:DsrE/DsrF/DrsH-like family protein [Spirochaetota bacterium]HPC39295.1 DsrE/DsrF/DrsH-like family protein [Spirochaetota bacterium]HPL16838.1 DsrE/DsrF/DrsH-like family protein [Spirochaetota bacterium]HQF08767.1 DsrE/DsrF/DrsH-like family protein [Spirochaetota bacterium]HQH97532.1 DsrE/DsrF/DrsH-like family protein [Spirochaetota bacterium]